MTAWKSSDIPSQHGRSAVVTGAGGLGYETALALAGAGADVIIASRNPAKGAEAVASIIAAHPHAKVRFEALDLANLKSVADFATRIAAAQDGLDLLVNNAGVMVPPTRQATSDGFEQQIGTNHLGHFALTAQLMPLLRWGRNARVVSLSSIAAHPGVARTELLHNGPGQGSMMAMARSLFWFMFQPAEQGALPTLYAATSADAKAGGYYGPDKFSETRGYPTKARVPQQALDADKASALWTVSEEMTGVKFG